MIKYAKKIGLDIIVTDHHLPGDVLPMADALINPQQKDCPYPFKELAGVGVAYQLARALIQVFPPVKDLDEKELLAFVALGTIADIVPLLGENRVLVKHGLDAFLNTSNSGLQSLMKVSGLSEKEINSEHVSFWLAPRLNATGRMADAYLSLELLLTKDEKRAEEIALELNRVNSERQKLLEQTLSEAVHLVEKYIDLKNERLIVLAWPNWHPGIIGLVASKLAEKYSRPAIVIALEGDIGRGSGRSVKNVDLYKIISKCEHLLTKLGGHHHAVGLTIEKKNIKNLRKEINDILINSLKWEDLQPEIDIDSIVTIDQINMNLISEINKFVPFGEGNPRPVFALKGADVYSHPRVLKNKHLKFQITKDSVILNAIGFNQADKISLLQNKSIDIVFNLDINNWQGHESINLQIKEIGDGKILNTNNAAK
ncbi:single-stranded-DNA-specific exonuclease RecJ [Candidatus Desantisbacteria bacterium]|nr:single-stranded-DNA-specific exonuclease RecJ [Candidatus Desantisbacteria bacterium]